MAPDAADDRHRPSLSLPVENHLAPPSPTHQAASPAKQTEAGHSWSPLAKDQQTYNDKYVVVYDFSGVGMCDTTR